MQNAVVISEQDINWIIDAHMDYVRKYTIESAKKAYPNGLIIFNIDDHVIGFHPGDTKIETSLYLDTYKARGIDFNDINFKFSNDIDGFMKKYFSKGFNVRTKLEKRGDAEYGYTTYKMYTVYSNDYRKNMAKRSVNMYIDEFDIPLEGKDKVLIRLFKKYTNKQAGVMVTNKFYDKKGKILGYRLTDGKVTKDVTSEALKNAIEQGRITVDNVTLTSDGRLYVRGI